MATKTNSRGGATADDYISRQNSELQPILKKLRPLVKKAAPQLDEQMKYGLPWYVKGERLPDNGSGLMGRPGVLPWNRAEEAEGIALGGVEKA